MSYRRPIKTLAGVLSSTPPGPLNGSGYRAFYQYLLSTCTTAAETVQHFVIEFIDLHKAMNSSETEDGQPQEATLLNKVKSKAEAYHQKTPLFRKLPGSAIAIVLLIAAINVLVWTACGIVLAFHNPGLVTTAALAYTL